MPPHLQHEPVGPFATLRRKALPWLQVVGFLLVILAVWMVVRQRDLLTQAWSSLRGAHPGLIAAVVLLPLANWIIVTILFHVLTNHQAKVRLGEMAALIGSAWLLNVVPMRPGLMGRVAYHKVVNGIPVKQSVKVIIFGIICNAVAIAIALTALGAIVLVNQASPSVLGFAAAAAMAFLLAVAWWQKTSNASYANAPMSPWRFTLGVALRLADYYVWVIRYYLAFSIIGFSISWPEAAGVAVASQLVQLLPVQVGPREWAVGLVASFLPSTRALSTSTIRTTTGLSADLLNRASELAVSLPIGLACTWWVYRRLRRHAG